MLAFSHFIYMQTWMSPSTSIIIIIILHFLFCYCFGNISFRIPPLSKSASLWTSVVKKWVQSIESKKKNTVWQTFNGDVVVVFSCREQYSTECTFTYVARELRNRYKDPRCFSVFFTVVDNFSFSKIRVVFSVFVVDNFSFSGAHNTLNTSHNKRQRVQNPLTRTIPSDVVSDSKKATLGPPHWEMLSVSTTWIPLVDYECEQLVHVQAFRLYPSFSILTTFLVDSSLYRNKHEWKGPQ